MPSRSQRRRGDDGEAHAEADGHQYQAIAEDQCEDVGRLAPSAIRTPIPGPLGDQ